MQVFPHVCNCMKVLAVLPALLPVTLHLLDFVSIFRCCTNNVFFTVAAFIEAFIMQILTAPSNNVLRVKLPVHA